MDIGSIADRAGDLYRINGRKDFPGAVTQALNEFSIVDEGVRDYAYREVCSFLSQRGALVKAAKALRLVEDITRAALNFLLCGRKFDEAIDAALDAFSVTKPRTRKRMHKKVSPFLSEQATKRRKEIRERARQMALSQQGEFKFR